MQIFIHRSTNDRTTLEVELSESIENVKQKIQNKKDIPKDQQRLALHGIQLQDERSLSDYDIYTNPILYLRVVLKIYLHLVDGKMYTFITKTEDEVSDLKQRIEDKLGISVDSQKIIHRGLLLKDNLPLPYCVFDKDTHNIIIKLRGY